MLENRLKPETAPTIGQLTEANIRIVMITGKFTFCVLLLRAFNQLNNLNVIYQKIGLIFNIPSKTLELLFNNSKKIINLFKFFETYQVISSLHMLIAMQLIVRKKGGLASNIFTFY